jgi:hypothetical protein
MTNYADSFILGIIELRLRPEHLIEYGLPGIAYLTPEALEETLAYAVGHMLSAPKALRLTSVDDGYTGERKGCPHYVAFR